MLTGGAGGEQHSGERYSGERPVRGGSKRLQAAALHDLRPRQVPVFPKLPILDSRFHASSTSPADAVLTLTLTLTLILVTT